jgi:hypothetical protein
LLPVTATPGDRSRWIVTVAEEEGHVPLVNVQTNILVPADNAFTVVVADEAEVTEALPIKMLHDPVPTEGVLPVNVALAEQTD